MAHPLIVGDETETEREREWERVPVWSNTVAKLGLKPERTLLLPAAQWSNS